MNKTRLSLYYLIGYTTFGGAAVPFLPKTMVGMVGLMFVAPTKESVYRKDGSGSERPVHGSRSDYFVDGTE